MSDRNEELSMEEKILETAEEMFLDKGFDGTSTVAIAKKVGCNQALVHYYYHSKENLFGKIFERKAEMSIDYLADAMEGEKAFEDRLKTLISNYFEFMKSNERLPFFLLNGLVSSEKWRKVVIQKYEGSLIQKKIFQNFDRLVKEEVAKRSIREIDTFNLLFDILSLSLSSFIALPIFKQISGDREDFRDEYLAMRRDEIVKLVLHGIETQA